ncbi:precorrin-6A/cobalt-precorrin-6A reductase [Synechococcus sp. PROS-U-1]|uniref:precorrin-6A/cobalt-precorrin-6A reductase n=1 Tax=Synechococcus sp. PROS-U-1 TaxID=1400866 RepID=UPI001648936F|nr:precorrin-6A/cobalt-precorrin-6A reductase [Synechococcus sp. PROS-U-1]QNJ02469.1 precorrin-6x reductase [Synechococcus sp. PROS-U-1]
MQGLANDQRRVLLLAGTGEGPQLVRDLTRRHWRVSVSVVTPSAANAYAGLALEGISVGALQGIGGITDALRQAGPFRWVLDATHPFASQISHALVRACAEVGQPLVRYERRLEPLGGASLVTDAQALAALPLQGQRLLLAIGGRHLPVMAAAVRRAGAIPYGRALPSPDGLCAALRAGLPPDHLAVVRPLQGDVAGAIERALCRRWGISAVLCRQSGGVTEQLWHRLTRELELSLLLLRRPAPPDRMVCVEDVSTLLEWLERD